MLTTEQQAHTSLHLLQVACEWGLTPTQESILTSLVFAGMCIGAVTWGWLSDAAGRRGAFLTSAAVTVFFSFASALAPNYTVSHCYVVFRGKHALQLHCSYTSPYAKYAAKVH